MCSVLFIGSLPQTQLARSVHSFFLILQKRAERFSHNYFIVFIHFLSKGYEKSNKNKQKNPELKFNNRQNLSTCNKLKYKVSGNPGYKHSNIITYYYSVTSTFMYSLNINDSTQESLERQVLILSLPTRFPTVTTC